MFYFWLVIVDWLLSSSWCLSCHHLAPGLCRWSRWPFVWWMGTPRKGRSCLKSWCILQSDFDRVKWKCPTSFSTDSFHSPIRMECSWISLNCFFEEGVTSCFEMLDCCCWSVRSYKLAVFSTRWCIWPHAATAFSRSAKCWDTHPTIVNGFIGFNYSFIAFLRTGVEGSSHLFLWVLFQVP